MDIRGFKALRPRADKAKDFSTLPYDVVSDEDVQDAINNNTNLFFEVIKTDSLYQEDIYNKARENLEKFKKDGILLTDEKKSFYIYQEVFGEIKQTGIVATINIDEYINGRVKRHEKTLKEKEVDRIHNFYYCNANTEPVFLFQKKDDKIKNIIDDVILNTQAEYDFVSEDNVRHVLWKIDDGKTVEKMENIFKDVDCFYIADGHHRSASAIEVGKKIRKENPNYDKNAEFNYYMGVIFFEDELKILPYNRVIKDISKYDMDKVWEDIKKNFSVEELDSPVFPSQKYSFTMIVDGKSYCLKSNDEIINQDDIVNSLDTVILHKNIIEPLFKITDIKNEDEIAFIGGTNIQKKLSKLTKGNIIFLMYPTQIEEVKKISDAGEIMPPKSTWFEPKLRSGLFIHEF